MARHWPGAARNNMIFLWQVPAGKLAAALAERMYPGPITTVAFSPNGAMLATADNYSRILLWNVATGKRTITLSYPAKNTDIAAVAFSPDGKTLATTDYTSTHLWQVSTGTQTAVLSDSAGMGDAVAFSPDGAMLAVATNGGSTLLWNLSTRKVAATLSQPDGENTAGRSRSVATVPRWPPPTPAATATCGIWPQIRSSPPSPTQAVRRKPRGFSRRAPRWRPPTLTVAPTCGTSPPGSSPLPSPNPPRIQIRAASVAFSPNGALLATSDNYGGVYLWKVS